jgi:hypothetical protein
LPYTFVLVQVSFFFIATGNRHNIKKEGSVELSYRSFSLEGLLWMTIFFLPSFMASLLVRSSPALTVSNPHRVFDKSERIKAMVVFANWRRL